MLGFSDVLTNMVQDLRVKELNLSKDYRRLLCLRVLLGTTTPGFPSSTMAITNK